jgi:midasin (ATPase involved in ribosome maturation)
MVAEPGAFVDLVYVMRMRTEEDRARLRKIYNSVMPVQLAEPMNPSFSITDEWVQIGHATVPRRNSLPRSKASRTEMLPRLLCPLQALLKCVEMGWLAIVVGPPSSGKTSLVRLAAELTGNVLHEFAMNSSVDTTELLGGFEQVDVARHTQRVIGRVSRLVDTISSSILRRCFDGGASESTDTTLVMLAVSIQTAWEGFLSRAKFAKQLPLDGDQRNSLSAVLRVVSDAAARGVVSLDALPPECHPDCLA